MNNLFGIYNVDTGLLQKTLLIHPKNLQASLEDNERAIPITQHDNLGRMRVVNGRKVSRESMNLVQNSLLTATGKDVTISNIPEGATLMDGSQIVKVTGGSITLHLGVGRHTVHIYKAPFQDECLTYEIRLG